MKDAVGLILLGVGGWILYEWFMNSAGAAQASAPPVVPSGATNSTAVTPPGTGQPASAIPPPKIGVFGKVLADVNHSFQSAIGINGAAPIVVNVIPSDGRIFDTNGNDITGTFDPVTAAAIVSTIVATAAAQNVALNGLHGLGRVYVSGMGGLGIVGAGYGVNQLRINSDATSYELAEKGYM